MAKDGSEEWSLPEDARAVLRERFEEFVDPVVLVVFTKPGENEEYSRLTVKFIEELGRLSPKIQAQFKTMDDPSAKLFGVTRSPTIIIQPDQYHIRVVGAPFGEEGRSFIGALVAVSRHEADLSEESKSFLSKLKEPRLVQVLVTTVCPFCPGQVLNAVRAAVYSPKLVTCESIDVGQFPDVAAPYHLTGVPLTLMDGKPMAPGYEPEEKFIEELVTLKPVRLRQVSTNQEAIEVDLVIIGAGPAGLTAGIYAARSGMRTVVLERNVIGGQVALTPVVENWPGVQSIPGRQLMELISAQARSYVPIFEGEDVLEVKIGKHVEVVTTKRRFQAKVVVLAMGAVPRKLAVSGEERFAGHGVSYCATCDGFFFRGKPVAIVGSGNTALTDALYLKSLGASPTIVSLEPHLTADAALVQSVEREKIPVLFSTQLESIAGVSQVTSISVKNRVSGERQTLKVDGVFVAIGTVPNNRLAGDLGVTVTSDGFVLVDRFGRTNIPRVLAAGDVTGGVRQIVTAVGGGATAAVTAFQDIQHPFWIPKTSEGQS